MIVAYIFRLGQGVRPKLLGSILSLYMKKATQALKPSKQAGDADKKPIHIGIPLVMLVSLLYIWWFWGLHTTTQHLFDDAEKQRKLVDIEYVQRIYVAKNQPAITLAKNDPFRPYTRWIYVSESSPLPDNYTPVLSAMTVAHSKSVKDPRLHPDASRALSKLFKKAEQSGFPLIVASAYRSTEEQKQLKTEYLRQHGQALADAYVADPATSEHETGLAVDVNNKDSACEENSDWCSLSPATVAWIADNAPDFGFIVRYPEGKEAQTGIGYEPWHLRYIGKDANALSASKLTLDEFVEKVRQRD